MSKYIEPAMPKLHDIVKAIGDCVANATEADKAKLSNAIEAYASRYPRCYDRLHHENPLLAEILGEIEEASDARPGMTAYP